jgi:HK97 family phage major capsid protein
MSDVKKFIDEMTKKVADLSKAVTEKVTSKENLEKQVKDLVDSQLKSRKETMAEELRKGVYSRQRDQDVKPQEMVVEKSDDPKVGNFQRWNDDVYILSKILDVHPKTLKTWDKYAPKYSDLRKAMDSAESGGGTDWVPTNFSSDLIQRIDLAQKVAGLFRKINMPTDPYKLPTLTAHPTAYKVAESTADGAMDGSSAFTNSQATSGAITLDATKLGVATEFSLELSEDSIIPVLDMVKNQIAIAMSFGLEDALINGDTAVTHQDADVTGSTDVRKAWNGLRKIGTNTVSVSTFNLSALRDMRRKMSRYGVNPSELVWIVSAKGYIRMLQVDEVITLEKYGPNATILNGELGRIDGIPIIVSEKMRDDLNASGVNDATTNDKGLILLVHTPSFVIGQKRAVTMKSFEDVRRDQIVVVNTWRGDFKNVQPSSDPIVVEGVNLTT